MRKFLKPVSALVLIASLAAGVTADAHAVWFAQRSKQLALIFGIGADDLDMVKRLPTVQAVAGYDAAWKPISTKLRTAGAIVVVDSVAVPTVVTAKLFYGIWCKRPDGEWVKKGKDEEPNCVVSEKNYKYAVYINGPLSSPIPAFKDQTLEIVPVDASIPAMMGQPLKLVALYQGKPMAGVKVLTDFVNDPDATPLVTGDDGTVTITVRNQGLNVVNAVYTSASDEPTKASQIEHESTLTFVLPHKPE